MNFSTGIAGAAIRPTDAINIIRTTIADIDGVTLPAALDNDLRTINADLSRAGAHLRADGAADRLAVALLDLDDPLTDPAVQADLAALAIARANLGPAIDAEVHRRHLAAIRTHATAVIKALAGGLDRAGKDIAAARAALPGEDFRRPLSGSVPAGQMTTWGKARDAVVAAGRIATAWSTLARATGAVDPHTTPLIVTAATLPQLNALPARDAEAAANAGLPLKLATFADYRTRVAAVEQQRAEAERARAEELQARRDKFRL